MKKKYQKIANAKAGVIKKLITTPITYKLCNSLSLNLGAVPRTLVTEKNDKTFKKIQKTLASFIAKICHIKRNGSNSNAKKFPRFVKIMRKFVILKS